MTTVRAEDTWKAQGNTNIEHEDTRKAWGDTQAEKGDLGKHGGFTGYLGGRGGYKRRTWDTHAEHEIHWQNWRIRG